MDTWQSRGRQEPGARLELAGDVGRELLNLLPGVVRVLTSREVFTKLGKFLPG